MSFENCGKNLFCSYKFGRKIQRIKSLSELSQFMDISMLPIPKEVRDYSLSCTSELCYTLLHFLSLRH